MIIVTRPRISDAELDHIRERVEALGCRTHISRGEHRVIIGCVGDESALAEVPLLALPGVESATPILRPYKLASREFSSAPDGATVINVGDAALGGAAITMIAGPCSVEGREMLLETARAVSAAGASMLRGGAFKPRTSPYAFQGLGEEGLEILAEVRELTGLPVVTEVMDTRQVELVARYADVLQVGARNMQNFSLLAEVGRADTPVLLKRGLSATVRELLMAAEYVMAQGNHRVILCERGIRTFETAMRNTLDIGAIPILKEETHLPVLVDPSHAAGRVALVAPLACAAIAAGADGLLVEVHPSPETARSDGEQSLTFDAFSALVGQLVPHAVAAGRSLEVRAGGTRREAAAHVTGRDSATDDTVHGAAPPGPVIPPKAGIHSRPRV
ncbi:MAG: 3-deoxy-7-phosphoheptulonate synthase [Gemmatimonadaceae bacterium]